MAAFWQHNDCCCGFCGRVYIPYSGRSISICSRGTLHAACADCRRYRPWRAAVPQPAEVSPHCAPHAPAGALLAPRLQPGRFRRTDAVFGRRQQVTTANTLLLLNWLPVGVCCAPLVVVADAGAARLAGLGKEPHWACHRILWTSGPGWLQFSKRPVLQPCTKRAMRRVMVAR